jgi:hypothetical protein
MACWSGAHRLLFAVLQDAVVCWFRYCHVETRRAKRLLQETRDWFWAEERDWLFAFERICELLNLDPDYIRRGLIRWQAAIPDQQTPFTGVQLRRRSDTRTVSIQRSIS